MIHARTGRGPARVRARAAAGVVLLGFLGLSLTSSGCYAPQLALLRSGLDSLRVVVDTMRVRDSVGYAVLADSRRELAQQRDILLSTRATTGSTTQEMFDQMQRLEGRLDDVLQRFQTLSERQGPLPVVGATPPGAQGPAPAVPAPDPAKLYDQATQDLTQGRYPLALTGYRDFISRFPMSELADDAQYGIGECFFAQAAFDSAAVEYAVVPERYPKGNRVPAALYKLGLSQERLGRNDDSKRTLQDLVRRYPSTSEAKLARERLGGSGNR